MGAYTAQILIGESHPYENGIFPFFKLYFSENDSYSWLLYNDVRGDKTFERIRWILLPEMIDEAVLMIALHVVKSSPLIEYALNISKNALDPDFNPRQSFTELQRDHMYALCKDMKNWPKLPKLIITLFQDSQLVKDLDQIKKYPFKEIVICMPTYIRDDIIVWQGTGIIKKFMD
jgi:hypothetical protein